MSSEIKQELAAGYTNEKRSFDVLAVILFFVCEIWLWLRLAPAFVHHPFLGFLGIFTGYIFADFVSGLVHWIGDTWGSAKTPFLGPYFIRPFREHHVDQTAITRHDFIQTNGSNCLATLFILIPANLLVPSTWGMISFFLYTAFASTSLGVFGTNQFHKWAHRANPSKWILWLQKHHLILAPRHHDTHHHHPFNRYYCITVGWLNPILDKIHFFQGLERVIIRLTGALPRQEDLRLVEEVAIESPRPS